MVFLGGFEKQALVAERADRQIIFLQHKLMQLNVAKSVLLTWKAKQCFLKGFLKHCCGDFVCCVPTVPVETMMTAKCWGSDGILWSDIHQLYLNLNPLQSCLIVGPVFFPPAHCAHILCYFNSVDLLFCLFPWWVNTLTFYPVSILFTILQSKHHLIYLSIFLITLEYEVASHINSGY